VSKILIAIGGSGQIVLHHYLQLHLIGFVQDRFDAYVLDSDQPIASLPWLSRFLDDVQEALGPQATKEQVPSLRLIELEPGRPGASVDQILTQEEIPPQPGFHHPAQAFFSRETLLQDVRSGLFGRPALSAVMALGSALRQIDPGRLPRDAKIVMICSCIGGTGAGLAIPLLWYLAKTPGTQFQLRAVLLGDYFVPRSREAVGDDVARFRSNRTAFLRALQQSVGQLQAFAYIEEPKMPERDPQREQRADRLPWSAPDLPYWQAAAATEFLLRESITAVAEEFSDRCVDAATYKPSLKHEPALARLSRSLGCLNSMIWHKALIRLGREAFLRTVWGDPLTESLKRFWTLTKAADAALDPVDFLDRVHGQMQALWDPGRGQYALSRVFPECALQKVLPETIRQVRWPVLPEATGVEPFRDPQGATRRVASAYVYAALRNVR